MLMLCVLLPLCAWLSLPLLPLLLLLLLLLSFCCSHMHACGEAVCKVQCK